MQEECDKTGVMEASTRFKNTMPSVARDCDTGSFLLPSCPHNIPEDLAFTRTLARDYKALNKVLLGSNSWEEVACVQPIFKYVLL
jgi:hypothetical protein